MTTPTAAAALLADADRCVRCGLCLPHCPTFRLQGLEAESPRGRVVLAEALARGEIDAGARMRKHLDSCLSCGHCERVCPARVPVVQLVARARHLLGKRSMLERIVLDTLAHPRRLRAAIAVLGAAQGVGWLRRHSPRLAALPRAQAAEPARGFAAHGEQRGRVALLPGCIANHLDGPTRSAAIRVLTRLGYSVTVPEGPACCGALHRHWGEAVRADRLWARASAGLAEFDAVLVAATGCRSALPEGIGSGSATPLRELCDFLADHRATLGPMLGHTSARVLLHMPCTRRNDLLNPNAEMELLGLFPGVDVLKTDPEVACCGAAGTHFLSEPGAARSMAAPVIAQAEQQKPHCILSSNIGCTLHLKAELLTAGLAIPIIHPVQFISERLSVP